MLKRLPISLSNKMSKLLNLALFLILFALTSSCVSLWFDVKRQSIHNNLDIIQAQQREFIVVSEALWMEYASLIDTEHKMRLVNSQKLISSQTETCKYEILKLSQTVGVILPALAVGEQFITSKHRSDFRIDSIKDRASRLSEIRIDNSLLQSSCDDIKNYEVGEATKATISDLKLVLKLANFLKFELEETAQKSAASLEENFQRSNIAIFLAFIFQVIVFLILKIADRVSNRSRDIVDG
jgi:hypothetical protein